MNKKPINKKPTNNKNETITLIVVLSICLVVLAVITVSLFAKKDDSTLAADTKSQHVEMALFEGMKLADAKEMLRSAGISYEIIPTQSKMPNKVEKIEYVGKVENGKTLIEIGTTVKLHANEVASDKIVYLTFDDGPIVNYTDSTLQTIYHNTGEILDILNQYDAKATFFLVGNQMIKSDRVKYVKDIYNQGHLIACHSFSHNFDYIYQSTDNFMLDIERFENELKVILGEETYNSIGKYMRFPGGTIKNGIIDRQAATSYISAVREAGYKVYDWTSLTGDAEGKETPEEMMSYMISTLEDAKNRNRPLILLMHDKDSTKEALPKILDYLISKGYYFDTIDNCPEYTDVEN